MEAKLKVICDFQTSPFCHKEYKIGKYRIIYNRRNNNGKYRCKLCAINDTHLGYKSHYFKNFKIDHNFFNNIDSEIKAYLLGVIAGDGHISAKQIEIVANSTDEITLKLFQTNVAPDVKIRDKKASNCKIIKILSRQIVCDLCRHLDIMPGKKSDKISLPKLNKTLMMHFIRGLMDTDGCIDNPFTSKYSPRCFYSSTSAKIIDQVHELYSSKNINSYINGIKLYFSGKYAIQFMDSIYNDANYFLPRKKNFYDMWKTWIPYQGTTINPSKRKLRKIEHDTILHM